MIQTASLALTVPKGSFDETIDRARIDRRRARRLRDQLLREPGRRRAPRARHARRPRPAAELRAGDGGAREARQGRGARGVRSGRLAAVRRSRGAGAPPRGGRAPAPRLPRQDDDVADALVVQDRLDEVQLQLEQVRGQLRYLDDQTSFATISLDRRRARRAVAAPTDDGGWGITDAWRAAARGLVKVVGGAFVALVDGRPDPPRARRSAFLGGRYLVRRRQARAGRPPPAETLRAARRSSPARSDGRGPARGRRSATLGTRGRRARQ